ncbi:hypothetical protein BNJ_00283 [Kaumoebavirus]|uniref:hypothetical protein n=1 Tax=Kaumoebavirus TaxID=1859492 RepID=UPI0009C26ADD|nr:hypothetical protein BNJ_00283 [Kaumoebavirus]ARA72106.1 hypothetical protein BNJ_00283 [Kaumoebavirus]
MSLYWILAGKRSEETVEKLYKMAGITGIDPPRWRDTYISIKKPVVKVLTRTGGGNREAYEDCNDEMTEYDTYIKDKDCHWDTTYAVFSYKILPEYIAEWEAYVAEVKKEEAAVAGSS